MGLNTNFSLILHNLMATEKISFEIIGDKKQQKSKCLSTIIFSQNLLIWKTGRTQTSDMNFIVIYAKKKFTKATKINT